MRRAGRRNARLRRGRILFMMLRVLVAGALVGLPLLVSGATAQTPATPPGFSRVSGCAGQSGERALGAPRPGKPLHADAERRRASSRAPDDRG